MAEILDKMEENVSSAFLEENCNFLIFKVVCCSGVFFVLFLKRENPTFPELSAYKLWRVTVSEMKATICFQRQWEEGCPALICDGSSACE